MGMNQRSLIWEADSHSASREILRVLWNMRVHYRVHKSPPLAPILTQTDPVHTFPNYFPKIHFNIMLQSTPRSSKWFLPFMISHHDFLWISHLSHACYMLRHSHFLWLDFTYNIWWSVQVMKLHIMQSSPDSHYILHLRSKHSLQHSVLIHP